MKKLKAKKDQLLSIEDLEASKLEKKEEADVVGGISSSVLTFIYTTTAPITCESICLSSCAYGGNLITIGGVSYVLTPVSNDISITTLPVKGRGGPKRKF